MRNIITFVFDEQKGIGNRPHISFNNQFDAYDYWIENRHELSINEDDKTFFLVEYSGSPKITGKFYWSKLISLT